MWASMSVAGEVRVEGRRGGGKSDGGRVRILGGEVADRRVGFERGRSGGRRRGLVQTGEDAADLRACVRALMNTTHSTLVPFPLVHTAPSRRSSQQHIAAVPTAAAATAATATSGTVSSSRAFSCLPNVRAHGLSDNIRESDQTELARGGSGVVRAVNGRERGHARGHTTRSERASERERCVEKKKRGAGGEGGGLSSCERRAGGAASASLAWAWHWHWAAAVQVLMLRKRGSRLIERLGQKRAAATTKRGGVLDRPLTLISRALDRL
ncbi:hypothetical protein PYCCODRAFT_932036 [Trametes coccinea BRFM310]|uniref:Uncharacterized protein n=1 Tax=Trametes coccinea (strain BRFM310) TaxID=1353009 RepID=A0A1Y2J0J4_TRAC3|nr:hypothetical protein PYCCODRAFT_932036 [Trametes coccinea BRFM310]